MVQVTILVIVILCKNGLAKMVMSNDNRGECALCFFSFLLSADRSQQSEDSQRGLVGCNMFVVMAKNAGEQVHHSEISKMIRAHVVSTIC